MAEKKVNKVVFGGETIVDLTGDTVTEETLLEGETAHNKAGERIVGRAKSGDVLTVVTVMNDVSDMTPAEIAAARSAGDYVVCVYPQGVQKQRSSHYDFIRADDTEAIFEGITKLPSGSTWLSVMTISADRSVAFKSGEESRVFLASGTGAGGSVDGSVQAGGIVKGSWLQTANLTKAKDTSRIGILDADGWVYYMDKSQLVQDVIAAIPAAEGRSF